MDVVIPFLLTFQRKDGKTFVYFHSTPHVPLTTATESPAQNNSGKGKEYQLLSFLYIEPPSNTLVIHSRIQYTHYLSRSLARNQYRINTMPAKGASTAKSAMRLPPLPRLRVRRPNQTGENPCIGIMASVLCTHSNLLLSLHQLVKKRTDGLLIEM